MAAELRGLGDAVRAGELEGRLKAARQEAGRALRDRLDLFSDGGETIRLGLHRFAVNTQPIDLTLVPHSCRDGEPAEMRFAITGTDYRAPVPGSFADTRPFWDQLLVSETPDVHRAEHLAAALLDRVTPGAPVVDLVRRAAEERHDEGYERGVHDHDAAAILDTLVRLRDGAGLLRYPPDARAAAQLFWAFGMDKVSRATFTIRATSLVRARAVFGSAAVTDLSDELGALIGSFLTELGPTSAIAPAPAAPGTTEQAATAALAGEYLVEELACAPAGFVGSHPRIADRKLELRLHELLARTRRFRAERVPAYRDYRRRRNRLVGPHWYKRLRGSGTPERIMDIAD